MVTFFFIMETDDITKILTNLTGCTSSVRHIGFAKHVSYINTHIKCRVLFCSTVSTSSESRVRIFPSLLPLLVKILLFFFLLLSLLIRGLAIFREREV